MRPSLPFLVLGFAAGAAGTWFVVRSAATTVPTAPVAAPSPVVLSSWDWRASATPPPLTANTTEAAIVAWLDLRDPSGATADFDTRAEALRVLLSRMPAEAFPSLLTPLSTRTGEDEMHLLHIAFDAWVERDPAAAARWAVTLPAKSPPGPDDLARQAARAWAAIDAEAAATWACALPDESLAQALAATVLGSLAEHNPARAVALANTRGKAFFQSVGYALMRSVAKEDPAAALRTYGPDLWDNGQGFWRLQEQISAWIARDPTAALTWVLSQPRRGDDMLANMLGNLSNGGKDRATVATALATVPGVPNRQQVLGNLLFAWGANSPDEALAWLNSLDDTDLRDRALEMASHSYFTEHPEKSLPLALAMPEGANRNSRLAELLGLWASHDPSAALAWINAHDDPGVAAASSGAQAAILGNIARDEPATAVAEWEKLSDPRTKSLAIAQVAKGWAKTDPLAALQWMSEQKAAAGVAAYPDQDMIFSAAQQDPEGALHWAEAEPKQFQMQALLSLAGNWQSKADRATTADLYTQISDPDLRTRVLSNHLREWLGKDPAAARTWIDTHNALTPEQAAKVLQGASTTGG